MNCPSRTESDGREGWNQNPALHAGTTNEDFNGRTNDTARRSAEDGIVDDVADNRGTIGNPPPKIPIPDTVQLEGHVLASTAGGEGGGRGGKGGSATFLEKAKSFFITYGSFVGPGFMVRIFLGIGLDLILLYR